MRDRLLQLIILVSVACVSGCAATKPDLARIYAKQEGSVDQPPVILIHGALGSRLYDRKARREIWPGPAPRVIFSQYQALELEIDSLTLKPKRSRLEPSGITSSIGGVDFYGQILDVLENAGGYHRAVVGDARENLEKRYYVFDYDWRQDNVRSARELDAFISQIRLDYHDPELKVDIVAHSLGGLIARYFIRYGTVDTLDDNDFPVNQRGARQVRRVILLGTPNLGSADAFRTLARGYKLLLGTVPVEVVATFPSTYQVLPHAINNSIVTMDGTPLDHDKFNVEFWRNFQFSVFDPRIERRILNRYENEDEGRAYLDLLHRYFEKHLERARRFSWSLTVPVENPSVEYIVFGSDCVDTPAKIVLEEEDGVVEVRLFPHEIRKPLPGIDYVRLMLEPGDGVVTKASLLARQTFDPTVSRHRYSYFPLDYPIFLCESHGHLTGNIHFQNNLLHALLSVDR